MAICQQKLSCENLFSIRINDVWVVIQNSFGDIVWPETIPLHEMLGMAKVTHAQGLGWK